MKLFGLCVVKDEADVIQQSLTHALEYCDRIIVLDNGSTDATWSILQDLSQQYSQKITLFGQITEPFRDSIRSHIYNQFHTELTATDWWLRLDADEFLAEDPRPYLERANHEQADFIKAWQIQFYYTDIDHEQWLEGRDSTHQPITERRRYYKINWREYRLFRNQPEIAWDTQSSPQWPNGLCKVSHQLLFNRHYQYRDPDQIQKRLHGRYLNPEFQHVNSLDWQSHIYPSRKLHYLHANGGWQFNPLDFYRLKLTMLLTGKAPTY